jgi:hypothetical protein
MEDVLCNLATKCSTFSLPLMGGIKGGVELLGEKVGVLVEHPVRTHHGLADSALDPGSSPRMTVRVVGQTEHQVLFNVELIHAPISVTHCNP